MKDGCVHLSNIADAAAALGRRECFRKFRRTVGVSISGKLNDDAVPSEVPQDTSNQGRVGVRGARKLGCGLWRTGTLA